MQLIDGKATATAIKAQIAQEVENIVAGGGKRPHLAAVLVGHDGGSETYVKNKVIACEQCGFKSTLIRYEADVTEEELLACVDKLNKDADVDGFIVQLPLPKHIDEQKITLGCPHFARFSARMLARGRIGSLATSSASSGSSARHRVLLPPGAAQRSSIRRGAKSICLNACAMNIDEASCT